MEAAVFVQEKLIEGGQLILATVSEKGSGQEDGVVSNGPRDEMSWARVDDGLFEHPKFADLSDRAKLLFIAGLVYGNKHLTGGFIPPSGLRITKAWAKASTKHVMELVTNNLWELRMDGHLVHDWDHYNLPAATVKARQQAARERMARVRSQRRSHEQGSPVPVSPTHIDTPTPTPSQSPNSASGNSSSPEHTGKETDDECEPSARARES